jgi:hypothetical protein
MASVATSKRAAYAAAAKYGCTIDYERGERRWSVNVNAPDGMAFNGDTLSLVTSWLTAPTAEFWDDVRKDIESNGPHIEVLNED